MNKISVMNAVHSDMSPREATPIPARPAMSSLELTPLAAPGSARDLPGRATAGPSSAEVPGWRHALFTRAFDAMQLKLADRRRTDDEAYSGTAGNLSAAERRDCDMTLHWISACLMPAREP